MTVKDLQSHSAPYVTVAELAEYWLVDRRQIYKQIDAGTLPAVRLGERLLRIRTSEAQAFERSAKMGGESGKPTGFDGEYRRRPANKVHHGKRPP